MKSLKLTFIFSFFIVFYGVSQQKTIVSNLQNLKMKLGESFTPTSFVLDSDEKRSKCNRMIYYNKKGVFSSAKSIYVDNQTGTIKANEPGIHEIVAICIGEGGKRLTRTFEVNVMYPKVKEIRISIETDKIYSGTYVPISYEVIDEMGYVRNDVDFSLK